MHPRTALVAKLLILCALVAGYPLSALQGQEAGDLARARAIESEVQRLSVAIEFWPGYSPTEIPLAIYTGAATYLFRHPSAPADFEPVAGTSPVVLRYEGRHPAVTSNSSAEIGDKKTATLLAEASRGSAARLAAVALHEGFHVFQRTRHPAWVANEGELFLYPFSDPDQLAWRRMETEMLRRAVAATEDDTAACWSGAAMSARSQRYAALDERFRAYEIGNEWNEGLAQYVQHRAIGDSPLEFPEAGFEATALRTRFYTVGPALGLLLDRLRPQWRTDLEEDDARPVHELFEEAVEGSATCTLSAEEIGAFTERAHRDAAAIGQDRQNRRVRFDADPGPRLVIVAAPDEPFWPQGFDPLNVEVIDGGLLHSRMLELGNDRGSVTAIDGDNADLTVLTIAAGDHPLFNGVRRVEILGVSDLEQSETEGRVHLSGPGLEVDLGPAEVETTGSTTRVRVAVPSVDS